MRKFFVGLVVLLFAVPVMGSVTIQCTANGHVVTVGYVETEPNHVRAFALDITVDSGAKITAVDDLSQDYYVHPGSFTYNDSTVGGTIVCDPNYPGTLSGLDSSGVTIEMGSLYEGGPASSNAPPADANLFTFTVDKDCNYSVAANVIRGSVVMEDPSANPTVNYCSGSAANLVGVPNIVALYAGTGWAGDPHANSQITGAGLVVGNVTTATSDTVRYQYVISQNPASGTQVSPGTAVDYQKSDGSTCYLGQADEAWWTSAERPICFCYPRQCHGDADGAKTGTSFSGYNWVSQPDLDIMSPAWLVKESPKGPGILHLSVNGKPVTCADFDHDKTGTSFSGYNRVSQPDLDEMGLYWLVKESPKGPGTPADCSPGNRNP